MSNNDNSPERFSREFQPPSSLSSGCQDAGFHSECGAICFQGYCRAGEEGKEWGKLKFHKVRCVDWHSAIFYESILPFGQFPEFCKSCLCHLLPVFVLFLWKSNFSEVLPPTIPPIVTASPLLTCHLFLRKSLNFSEPLFLHLEKDEGNNCPEYHKDQITHIHTSPLTKLQKTTNTWV